MGAVLVVSGGAAFGRPAESQRTYATGTGTVTAGWRSAVVASHLLIAGVTFSGGSGTTITPPAGWQQIDSTLYRSDNGTTLGTAIYYIANCSAKTAGTTEVFTFSPASTVATVQLTEVAGIELTSPVDSIGNKTGTGNSLTITASTASGDTSEYGYLLVSSVAQTGNINSGNNGFVRTNSFLFGTSTQVANLDAGTSHRSTMESTLMTSAAGVAVSTTLTLPNALYSATLVTFKVQALHWIGAGSYPARPANPSLPDPSTCYGYFDDDACWSTARGGIWTGTGSPGVNDVVLFDSGGVGDCTMNPWTPATEQAFSIEIQSGYTGTITKSGSDLQLQRHFTIGGGSFVGAAGLNLRTNQTGNYIGDLDVQGGTLSGNGMSFNVRSLYVESGSFNVGAGTFNTNNAGVVSITGGTTTFGGAAGFVGAFTMTGGTVIGGTGAMTFGGAVTLNSLATLNLAAAASYSFTGNTQVLTGSTMTLGAAGSSMSPVSFPGTLVVRGSTGPTFSSFNAGSGAITVGGTTTIDQGATFDAGSGNLAFTGAVAIGASATSGTFLARTSTINFNNATASGAYSVRLQNSGSTLNGGTANITFGRNTLSGSYELGITAGTVDLSTATPTFNPSGALGNLTMSAGTSLTLGATPVTFPGTAVIAGTFTGGTGAVTFTGAVTNSGGALNLTSPSALTFSTSLGVSGGATVTTLGAQTVSIPGFTISSGTFNAGTTNLTYSGTFSSSGGVTNLTTAASLTFGTTFTISNGTVNLGSQTVSLPVLTMTGGTLSAGTAVVTVAGVTSIGPGTANFGSTTSGPTFQAAVTMSGGTLTLGSGNPARLDATLGMTGGTFNAGSSHLTIAGAHTMNSGVFNCGSGTVDLAGNLTMTGGTFNGQTGTTTIAGTTSIAGTTVTAGGAVSSNTGTLVFSGPVLLGGSDGTYGNISGNQNGTLRFEFPTTMMAPDALYVQGAGNLTVSNTSPSATIAFGVNAIAGTNAINLAGGSASINVRNGTTVTIPGGNVIVSTGTTLTMGINPTTFPANVTVAGTFVGSTGALTFSGPVSVSGTFSTGTGARTFSSTLDVTGSYTASTGAHTFTGAVTASGTFNLTNSASPISFGTSLAVSGGTTTIASQALVTLPTLSMSAGAFNVANAGLSVTGDVNITGGTATLSNTSSTISFLGNLNIGPGTLTAGAGTSSNRRLTVSGATTITANGVLNAGAASPLTLSGAVVLGTVMAGSPGTINANTSTTTCSNTVIVQGGSAFNANAAVLLTFANTFSLLGSSTFDGGTGISTFTLSPTLTSGTFNVGTAGTTGRVNLSANTAFASGVTLAFPSNRGEIRMGNGRTLTTDGPVTSSFTAGGTLPKIDCGACAAGMTVTFGASSTLNVSGLEFDDSVSTGVTVTAGATITRLEKLKFTANKANSTSTGASHLVVNSAAAVLNMPGCSFDATAQYNLTLNGTMASPGVRAVMEFQSTTVNGARGGESFDLDADSNDDNVADSSMANRWGSVIEWNAAHPTDTAGTAVGFPTAAFDWSTFSPYGVYVAYKNADGSNNDVLWLRNNDGTAGYSYTIPDASGDLIGTPRWDTESGTHVVYIATTTGHVIKLVDSGTSLALPSSGVWASEFFDNSVVSSITSPLISDGTNLYFGGTDGGGNEIFGLSVATKTIARTVGSVGAVRDAPSWKVYSGSTYLFVGSQAVSGTAHIYRVNMGTGMVDADFTGATASVNDSIRLINNRAHAVTDGGTLHVLDAANFNMSGFTNVSGFPYQSAAASPIKLAPFIDTLTDYKYFGDDAGNFYVVTDTGGNLAGYPFALPGAPQITSTPVYLPSSGVIAVGAADGYVYFYDRHNGSNAPALIRKYYVGTGRVSSVSYSYASGAYMVASSDGKLSFIYSSAVPDPTSATE